MASLSSCGRRSGPRLQYRWRSGLMKRIKILLFASKGERGRRELIINSINIGGAQLWHKG